MPLQVFRSKSGVLSGTTYKEVFRHAQEEFAVIRKRTKRQPYIRSKYFSKRKVFFTYFWEHIFQKAYPDRIRRLKLFRCAIDAVVNSNNVPTSKINPNRRSEIIHRFMAKTKSGQMFYYQIKEEIKGKKLNIMSVFPE